MNIRSFRCFGVSACIAFTLANAAVAAPAKKPVVKPKPKPAPKVGIKKTPQMAGAVGRFGELYGLKSGWTYEILSARYSYDCFDDYTHLYPNTDQKLLILRVAIKNNTNADLYFGENHLFQLQDANNQIYEGGAYRLGLTKDSSFSPSLKPGQGAGQDPGNPLEVAIPVAEDAQVTKLVLQQGRKGTSEDVMRFFIAGTQGGDPKNIIKPAPFEPSTKVQKPVGFYPSNYFAFRINSVTFTTDPIDNGNPPENRRFAVVNLTIKNTTSKAASIFDVSGVMDKDFFTDADGENYPASGDIPLLKASSDEGSEGEIAPGQERTVRAIFPVPLKGELKTFTFGASGSKHWLFDASGWK